MNKLDLSASTLTGTGDGRVVEIEAALADLDVFPDVIIVSNVALLTAAVFKGTSNLIRFEYPTVDSELKMSCAHVMQYRALSRAGQVKHITIEQAPAVLGDVTNHTESSSLASVSPLQPRPEDQPGTDHGHAVREVFGK